MPDVCFPGGGCVTLKETICVFFLFCIYMCYYYITDRVTCQDVFSKLYTEISLTSYRLRDIITYEGGEHDDNRRKNKTAA